MYQYILFTPSTYWKTYIYHQVCTSIYSEHSSTYLREKVHTWVKKYIQVHTWGKKYVPVHTGLCRFISVSYHSMVHTVHTGTYWYELGTYHWSGFQMEAAAALPVPVAHSEDTCNSQKTLVTVAYAPTDSEPPCRTSSLETCKHFKFRNHPSLPASEYFARASNTSASEAWKMSSKSVCQTLAQTELSEKDASGMPACV